MLFLWYEVWWELTGVEWFHRRLSSCNDVPSYLSECALVVDAHRLTTFCTSPIAQYAGSYHWYKHRSLQTPGSLKYCSLQLLQPGCVWTWILQSSVLGNSVFMYILPVSKTVDPRNCSFTLLTVSAEESAYYNSWQRGFHKDLTGTESSWK